MELALSSGRLVGAIAPTKHLAAAFEAMHGIIAYAASTGQPPHEKWGALIINDAHQITAERFLRLTGDVIPYGVDVIVTACPPTTKRGEWLLNLKEAGFAIRKLS